MRRGFTLVEVMVSLVILVIVALAAMQSMAFVSRQGVRGKEKGFAAQKCIQLMEELRAVAQTQSMDSVDALTDVSPVSVLSLHGAGAAGHLSDNAAGRFRRQLLVQRIPGQPDARRAHVKVYRVGTGSDLELLAESVNILRRPTSLYPASQVYDVYFLALENVMSSWTNPAELKPALNAVLNDFKVRNPGLEFNPHWITRLSIGRDPFYAPSVNTTRYSRDPDAFPGIYFYPSRTYDPSGGRRIIYFDHNGFESRHRKDDETLQDPAVDGRLALADQYNHALRYPQERDSAGRDLTWRLLLEKMCRGDPQYKNAILINLHGEALPMPPLRNYSDPVKIPNTFPGVRVVTHPQRLWSPAAGTNEHDINLRVYSHLMSPDSQPDKRAKLDAPITIRLPGVPGAAVAHVRFLGRNGDSDNFAWREASSPADYELDNSIPGEIRLRLKDSPLRHEGGGQGLTAGARLYGWEYIPCLVSDDTDFQEGVRDLDDTTAGVPKNTARWRIQIATNTLSPGEYMVETWIGDNSADRTFPNTSKTYFWVSGSQTSVPVTERYQFMGDPRHMPYADVKAYDGYNWYFIGPPMTPSPADADYSLATDYRGFPRYSQNTSVSPRLPEGWSTPNPDHLLFDVPRSDQLIREALMESHVVFGHMAGTFHGFLTIGGEFSLGNWGNGIGNGIPLPRRYMVADDSNVTVVKVDESNLVGLADERNLRRIQRRDGAWSGFPWTGELYPDDMYNVWRGAVGTTPGNLPSVDPGNMGNPSKSYYRARYGAPFGVEPSMGMGPRGAMSFMAGNAAAGGDRWFHVQSVNTTRTEGTLTDAGQKAAALFNLSLPPMVKLASSFCTGEWNYTYPPPQWGTSPYNARHRLTLVEKYVDNAVSWYASPSPDSMASAGLVTLTPPTAAPQGPAAHFVINGLADQLGVGPTQISRIAMTNILRSFLRLSAPDISADRGWIRPVPRVELEAPLDEQEYENPSTINVTWETRWARWNGFDYTEFNTPAYNGPLSDLAFNVKYSANGADWSCAATGLASTPSGQYDSACDVPVAASPTTFSWNAVSLPQGFYHVLVEAHTRDRKSHHAYHRARVHIRR